MAAIDYTTPDADAAKAALMRAKEIEAHHRANLVAVRFDSRTVGYYPPEKVAEAKAAYLKNRM